MDIELDGVPETLLITDKARVWPTRTRKAYAVRSLCHGNHGEREYRQLIAPQKESGEVAVG